MKKTIALVTGGFSGEAVISYKSAVTIDNNLDRERFNVYTIDVNPKGWFYQLADGRKVEIDKNDFSLQIDNQRIVFDAVFIGMHGTPGEDGKLQGYFDTLRIPYTSSDAATSAITFNKRYTVAVAKMAGIAVAESVHLFRHSPLTGADVLRKLQLPVFVKPNNGGSSIGMSKVDNAATVATATVKYNLLVFQVVEFFYLHGLDLSKWDKCSANIKFSILMWLTHINYIDLFALVEAAFQFLNGNILHN